ncbi:hypothetical protein BDW22DRAFT_1364467 [Trametopsis cervina]|nr:hypothetical protein BDW22DRAFT_1364467 [Trametopsis cervina]
MQQQQQQPTESGFQSLPQEIAETIFDALDGDVPTLSNCVLVSRVWASLSYPMRFRRVGFAARIAREGMNTGPRTFDDFLEVLRHSPRLCQCIQELTLKSQSAVGILDTTTLHGIVQHLPFLTALEVAVPYLYLSQAASNAFVRSARLQKLTIGEDCLWMSQESLSEMLSLFDEIEEINHYVSSMPMESQPDFVALRPSSRKLAVKSLFFSHGHRPVMTKAVESCLSIYSQILSSSTLRTFSIDPGYLSPEELMSYGRFVGELGKHLVDFTCGVYRRGPMTEGIDLLLPFQTSANMLRADVIEDGYPELLTARYAVGLEFSFWFQRVVTCGWDLAVRGLTRAPASVRMMCLKFEAPDHFLATFEGANVSPLGALVMLLETLSWSDVVKQIMDGHKSLEMVQVQMQVPAACFETAEDREIFRMDCESAVLARCLGDNTCKPAVVQVTVI